MSKFTHQQLCDIAVKWLQRSYSANGAGCQFAVSEIQATVGAFEQADAFGYRCNKGNGMGSWLVEAKTSRADFLADFKKPHRIDPTIGVGQYRVYICPEGVIQKEDLPPKWGLIWVNSRGHIKPIVHFSNITHYDKRNEWLESMKHHERNFDNEQYIMCRLLQRFDDVEQMNQRIKEANRLSTRAWAQHDKVMEQLNKQRNKNVVDSLLLQELSLKYGIDLESERKLLIK